MTSCFSPSGLDLCMHGVQCNTTTLTCDCSSSAFEHDFFFVHNENCGLPRNFYFVWLIYSIITIVLVVGFVAYETLQSKLEAKSMGQLTIIMLTFTICCEISLSLQRGCFEAGSIFLGLFVTVILILIYKFAMVFIAPIYAVRTWDIADLKTKTRPVVVFGCFTLMINAVVMAAYARQVNKFNIAMVTFLLQIIALGTLAGCSLVFFAIQLRREVQRISTFNKNSPLNVPAIKGRIFHALWGGVVVIVVCVGVIAPLVGAFLGLGMLPYAWVIVVIAYHAVIGLGASVGMFLHQRVLKKSNGHTTGNLLGKVTSRGVKDANQSKVSKSSDMILAQTGGSNLRFSGEGNKFAAFPESKE